MVAPVDVFGSYSITATLQLGSHDNVHSSGAVAVCVLSDNTILAAYVNEDTPESIRVVHLSTSLTILGEASIVGASSPTTGATRALHLCATASGKALLIDQDWWNNKTEAWPVTASSSTPVIGTKATHSGTYPFMEQYVGPFSIYNQTANRVVYPYYWNNSATSNREVWLLILAADTGAVVGRVFVYDWDESDSIGQFGFMTSPSDNSIFTVIDGVGKPWTVQVNLVAGTGSRTVGPSSTFNLNTITGHGLLQAAGSPYINGLVVFDKVTAGTYPNQQSSLQAARYPAGGSVVADKDIGTTFVYTQYTSHQMGPHLMGAALYGRSNFSHDWDSIQFMAIDQSQATPSFVNFALPFGSTMTTGIDSDNAAWQVNSRPSTGTIVVGAMVHDRTANKLKPHVWSIQGPIVVPEVIPTSVPAEPVVFDAPPEFDALGFYTDAGARYILGLFTGENTSLQYLWVALCRTAPNRYMSSEDLDEVDTEGYERILLIVATDWVAYQSSVFNNGEVSWTADGDVRGWAVLDSPVDGQVLYGGDWNEYYEATGTFTATRGSMIVPLAISDWAIESD